jgi:hypothetical protein
VICFARMLQFRGWSFGLAFALLMGAACSSTSSNSGGTGGSGTGGTTASDCCTARNEPGCTDKTLQACVCAVDNSCCSSKWTSLCVATAELNCNACGAGGGSGGVGGGEPLLGGAAGANPVCSPVQGSSSLCTVPANPSSKCCAYGATFCDDDNLQTCANDLDAACAKAWTDCCVDIVQAQGLCSDSRGVDAGM